MTRVFVDENSLQRVEGEASDQRVEVRSPTFNGTEDAAHGQGQTISQATTATHNSSVPGKERTGEE